MSAPAQAMHSDGVRLFDAFLEIKESQSQEEASPVLQEAVGNFVIAMEEDTVYGTPALASVSMTPPPLPQVDIVLETPEEDAGDEAALEADTVELGTNDDVEETVAITSNTQPLSQGTRAALSELSTDPLIMLKTKAPGSSSAPPLLHGTPQRDEDGDLKYPEGATADLKEVIDDINTRRMSSWGSKFEDVLVEADPGEPEELQDGTEAVVCREEDKIATRVHFKACVTVGSYIPDSTDVLQTEVEVTVREVSLGFHTIASSPDDADMDHESQATTSGMSSGSLAEGRRVTRSEQTSLSSQTEEQIITSPNEITPTLSGRSGKRKAAPSPREETLPSNTGVLLHGLSLRAPPRWIARRIP